MFAYYEMIVFGCLNQITEWYEPNQKEIVAHFADTFQSNRLLHLESTFVLPVLFCSRSDRFSQIKVSKHKCT